MVGPAARLGGFFDGSVTTAARSGAGRPGRVRRPPYDGAMPGTRRAGRRPAPLRVRRPAAWLPLVLAALLASTACDAGTASGEDDDASTAQPPLELTQTENPFAGRDVYTWPYSPVAEAAEAQSDPERASLLEQVAEVPTALWLTPEAYPVGSVAPFVDEVLAQARGTGEVPVFVLYGIPGRDCGGGYSAGGLPEADYYTWVQEFRDAVGSEAVAILEPDAVAAGPECGLVEDRRRILSRAVDLLADGPATYVDAGHAGWQDPARMAEELRRIGVDAVRGFSVNVAYYGSDDEERAYAQQIADSLGTAHYVVDSGRNGAGGNGEWCNPTGQALGQPPGAIEDGTSADARLWIKPPGESDGTCNGGPEAGVLWLDRAVELARNAGWPAQ